jgi:hypothetical protein
MVAYRTPAGGSERSAHAAAPSISVSAKAAEAYGGNAARLQVLKRRVDPDEPPRFQTEILSEAQARLYAVQKPFHQTLLMGKTKDATWHAKPSYYAVSTEDRTINPDSSGLQPSTSAQPRWR